MSDQYEEPLRVLGLEPGASEQAIKDAYRDLVKVWHPDRFGSDARLRAKAQEKLRELNAAFKQLRGYRASDFRKRTEPARPAYRPSDFVVVPVAESSFEHANGRRTVRLVILCAALIAVVAVGLFMWRSGAPGALSPALEVIQTPASESSPPAVRQPARPRADASTSPGVDGARASNQATTGSLIVTSRPLGARVIFDGRVVGETPMVVKDVTPGEHHIEMSLDGKAYEPWASSVVVTAGRDEKLLAVMTPARRER